MQADWIEALRKEVERTSQAAVARRLNYSSAAISQVLSGKYKASTDAIERIVRAELMQERLNCPCAGVITRRFCLETQDKARRGVIPASALHLELYATCTGGCPHSSVSEKAR